MTLRKLTKQELEQYRKDGKMADDLDVLAHRQEAVLNKQQARDMVDGKDVNPDQDDLTAAELRSLDDWEAQEHLNDTLAAEKEDREAGL